MIELDDFIFRLLIYQIRTRSAIMYRSNRSFNIPPGQPPGHLTFLKIIVQNPP